jgi:hypothetical protein
VRRFCISQHMSKKRKSRSDDLGVLRYRLPVHRLSVFGPLMRQDTWIGGGSGAYSTSVRGTKARDGLGPGTATTNRPSLL